MVDPDQTRATFEHGIVTIVLPKHAATRPRRITVHATGEPETLEGQAGERTETASPSSARKRGASSASS